MFSNNFLTGSSDAPRSSTPKPTRKQHESGRDTRQRNGPEGEHNALLESMGYAKNMRNLREELKWEMDVLRNEIKDSNMSCLENTRAIMKDIYTMMQELHSIQSGEALKLQFLTVREEMRSGLEYVAKSFEEQLSENASNVLSEVGGLRQHQEESQTALFEELHKVHAGSANLETLVSHSVVQITKLLNEQQSSSSEAFSDIRLITLDSSRNQSVLDSTNLDEKLHQHLQEHPVNVDFTQVIKRLDKSHRDAAHDTNLLRTEIAKIQQELHMDFAEVMLRANEKTMGPTHSEYPALGGSPMDARTSLAALMGLQKSLPGCPDSEADGDSQHSRVGDAGHVHLQDRPQEVSPPSDDMAMVAIKSDPRPTKRDSTKRVRHYFTQTESQGMVDQGMQTQPKAAREKPVNPLAMQRRLTEHFKVASSITSARMIVADEEALKKQTRDAMIKPQYNVFNDYWDRGCAQRIAKSARFQALTFAVILLNAIWMGVDLDHNDAATLLDAHPAFQVGEHLFCAFFSFEVLARFMAFRWKRWCVRDKWFVFDLLLVVFMVAETWILPGVLLALGLTETSDLGPVGILRVVRLAKMGRMARMVRLVRAFPELVVLLKGLKAAVRSVLTFFVLWVIMIYIYAVVIKLVTQDNDIGKQYFSSIPVGMNTMMFRFVIPEFAEIMDDVGREYPLIWPVLMSFIVLASITMLNMLVGVLVGVVGVLGAVEKETALVRHVASSLRNAMEDLARDTSHDLSMEDFRHILVQPEIAAIIQGAGTDVIVLLEQSDIIFESLSKDAGTDVEMSFEKFIDIVLNMRSNNPVTVKDINTQLRLINRSIHDSMTKNTVELADKLKVMMTTMRTDFSAAVEHMSALQEEEDY